jgi:predicted HTH transcriptional regulator
MTDLFTVDFGSLSNDQRYSAIAAFAQAQPSESNRHDFKLIWANDAVKSVAAFANTFGGILIIGVEKNQNDAEAKVAGFNSNSELTTGIASAIATNISPTPSYDIMECHKPGETNCRFCVIRVRNDSRLYLVTKKDISPAWVRNADQTIRADAAQLRGLIERER